MLYFSQDIVKGTLFDWVLMRVAFVLGNQAVSPAAWYVEKLAGKLIQIANQEDKREIKHIAGQKLFKFGRGECLKSNMVFQK